MRRRLYNRIKSQRKPLRREQMTIKDGDVIVQYLPINEDGIILIDYNLAKIYHKSLEQKFPNNIILTTPLEIEVISKTDIELKSEF